MEKRCPLHDVLILGSHLSVILVVHHDPQNVDCLASKIAIRLQFVIVPVPVEEPGDFLVYFLSDVLH